MSANNQKSAGRLSILQAAFVVARRDFGAILFSKSFLFFLLGPLFPLAIGLLAGGIGAKMERTVSAPQLGIAMAAPDRNALAAAHAELAPKLGSAFPELIVLPPPDENFDAEALLKKRRDLAAIVSGTLAEPVLTATQLRLKQWEGPVSLMAAKASGTTALVYPNITLSGIATSGAQQRGGQLRTAQAAQTLLFLLIMMLAGMVLSNLVEEKGNKVIEILAAALPMDAVFLGKLFAMLGISLVGISVWGTVGTAFVAMAGNEGLAAAFLNNLPEPGVGWALFLTLGVVYFGLGYLLLGSLFLAIGSMAATVREVQTLNMPVTMGQLLVFFFASFAVTEPGGWLEKAAMAFPLSSPFAMIARAAQDGAIWPHLVAIAWQALCVAVFVKAGAGLFRRRVMKSGGGAGKKRRSLIDALKGRSSPAA